MRQIAKFRTFLIVIARSAGVCTVPHTQLLQALKLINFDTYQVKKISKYMHHLMTTNVYFVATVVQTFSSVLKTLLICFISLWEPLMEIQIFQRRTIFL